MCAHRGILGAESLVCARQRPLIFPLRSYTLCQDQARPPYLCLPGRKPTEVESRSGEVGHARQAQRPADLRPVGVRVASSPWCWGAAGSAAGPLPPGSKAPVPDESLGSTAPGMVGAVLATMKPSRCGVDSRFCPQTLGEVTRRATARTREGKRGDGRTADYLLGVTLTCERARRSGPFFSPKEKNGQEWLETDTTRSRSKARQRTQTERAKTSGNSHCGPTADDAARERNPGARRAFCPDGDSGSRNRPFPRRVPGWMAQSAVVRDYRALENRPAGAPSSCHS
jgi:hypothetical protein